LLGITHYVDDRLEALGYLIGKVPNLYLFHPNSEEVERFKRFLPEVHRVESWKELTEQLAT